MLNGELSHHLELNSGESDFEIINHSDSDAEGNGYNKQKKDFFSDNFKRKLNVLEIERDLIKFNGDLERKDNSSDKNSLSSSQEQIQQHSVSAFLNDKERPTDLFQKSNSSDCEKVNYENIQKEQQNVTVPKIVLTTHKKDENIDSHNDTYKILQAPVIDLQQHSSRNQSSNPGLLFFQRKLIGSSSQSLDKTRIFAAPQSPHLEKSPQYQIKTDFRGSAKTSIPSNLKCRMCDNIYKDPRTLNCLHSFCFQCIVNENFVKDDTIPFWSRPDSHTYEWDALTLHATSNKSSSAGSAALESECPISPRPENRSSITTLKNRRSSERKLKASKSSPKHIPNVHHIEKRAQILVCSICQYCTEMPTGGIRHLPSNFILSRKIEAFLIDMGEEIISNIWCGLCCVEVSATHHCATCAKNLCSFCKEAHGRQKSTANHIVRNLLELRKERSQAKFKALSSKTTLKCSLHPGFEIKSFCITCQQTICVDCIILLHKGHKHDYIHKVFKNYNKLLKDTVDKSKPLCEYVEHSVLKMGDISKKIVEKCDQIQQEVEGFIAAYFEAVEVHRQTLLSQIAKAKETKIQTILEHQLDMEKRSNNTKIAVEFCEELFENASEVEILSLVNILLRRLEYCQKFKPPLDAKISGTLHFLPEIRAPSTKAQNNIPLYGIITTQTVEPQYCTLETEGLSQLRVHKKVELVILTRDSDSVPLCHGGLQINVQLKYKDSSSKLIEAQVSDKRDGSYVITFVPDFSGTITLSVTINKRHISGSPFTLVARTVRPHSGIFHCCTFCSSKGSKSISCACDGVMPGYKGCGHGHNGHPGRRHWSCCGNVLENSECTFVNKF